jgi:hypothetical protein
MAHARAFAALAVGLLLVAAACAPSGPDDPFEDADFRPTEEPELGPPPEEVDLPDTRGVVLSPVPGLTEDPVPVKVYGGEAALYGQVTAPGGDTGGAVVRLERFVGTQSDAVQVAVGSDGAWRARRLIGGRYRVRAFRAPDLAMISSQVFFLPAEDEVRLDLTVLPFGGTDLQAAFLAGTLEVGESATVTALAQEVAVDGDGVVRGVPLAGTTISADGGGVWDIAGAARAVGADGLTSWTVTCREANDTGIDISVGETTITVDARCRDTPVVAPLPQDPTPVSVVDVGDRFTPPLAGPVGPGTYEVVESSGTCAFVYQPYDGTQWANDLQTASGTTSITLTTFARDLEPLGGSTPCTYERVS